MLLDRMGRGDADAVRMLTPLIYSELHAIARRMFARESPGHTLQATAVAHEAWLRMADQTQATWSNRAHFLAIAAEMIRRILVDHARARGAVKRGGGVERVTLIGDDPGAASAGEADAGRAAGSDLAVDLLDLDAAMERLRALDERQARVVELRFFGGLSVEESARILGVSPRTVKDDWRFARAWLRRQLADAASGDPDGP